MKPFTMKVEEEDLARWKEAAHDERISLSEWIRRRCDAPAANPYSATAGSISTFTPEPKEILPILKKIISPTSECLNRLPKGSYCKSCGSSH